jgi:hypothetical protein
MISILTRLFQWFSPKDEYPIDSKGIYKDLEKVQEKLKEKYHDGRVGDIWEYRYNQDQRIYRLAGVPDRREKKCWIRFMLLEDVGVEGVPFFKSLVIATNDETATGRINKIETHKLRNHEEEEVPQTGYFNGYYWKLISRIDGEEKT